MLRDPARLAVILFVSVALLLAVVLWLRPVASTGRLQVLVRSVERSTNGAMLVTVVLTNGGTGRLNIVDDAAGQPAFIVDDGAEFGTVVGDLANTLVLFLNPGSTMTNVVTLTNPPVRFRLKVSVRDLEAEHSLLNLLRKERRYMDLPASAWIETN